MVKKQGVHAVVAQRLGIIRFVSVNGELSRPRVEAVQPRLRAEPQKAVPVLCDFLVLYRVLILGHVHDETSGGRLKTAYTPIHGGPQSSPAIIDQLHDRARVLRHQSAGIGTYLARVPVDFLKAVVKRSTKENPFRVLEYGEDLITDPRTHRHDVRSCSPVDTVETAHRTNPEYAVMVLIDRSDEWVDQTPTLVGEVLKGQWLF